MERVHQFSVQIAKYVFWSKAYGETVSVMPISRDEAATLGFESMVLFGLQVEGLPVRRIRLAREEEPINPAAFLLDVWRGAAAVHGLPDRLKVHHLVDAAWPQLREFVLGLEVQYEVALGGDKSFTAGLRVMQSEANSLGHHLSSGPHPEHFRLNDAAAMPCVNELGASVGGPKARERLAFYIQRPTRTVPEGVAVPALPSIASREFDVGQDGISPVVAVCVKRYPNVTWLLERTWSAEGLPLIVADGGALARSCDPFELSVLHAEAQPLLDCLPGSLGTIARALQIPRKRLDGFRNKSAELDEQESAALREFLALEYDDFGYLRASGAYLLQAKSISATRSAYEQLSHGGDLAFGAEILPRRGAADPSWRYVLVWPCCGLPSVIMFPRGSKVAELLDGDRQDLVNLGAPVRVKADFYRRVVRTGAQVCQEPDRFRLLMALFVEHTESEGWLNRLTQEVPPEIRPRR